LERNIKENANKGVEPSVNGIEIACRFFWEVGLSAIESQFPDYVDRLAVGLVAAGSDCAGNDDEVSRDYDWGPRFHVYLTESDFARIGYSLQTLLDTLPSEFCGAYCSTFGEHISYAYSIDEFFRSKTSNGVSRGFAKAPESPADWLRIPEASLFNLTRGQVFYDPLGEFTRKKQEFAAYYPEAAWHSRLADALVKSGDAGQNVLPRALARDDYFTAESAWWSFSTAAMRLGFLINRKYAPSDQWLYREFCKLTGQTREVMNLLWDGQCDVDVRLEAVRRIASIYSASVSGLVISSQLCTEEPENLTRHGELLRASIQDEEVTAIHRTRAS
jgi:hypothetical protein